MTDKQKRRSPDTTKQGAKGEATTQSTTQAKLPLRVPEGDAKSGSASPSAGASDSQKAEKTEEIKGARGSENINPKQKKKSKSADEKDMIKAKKAFADLQTNPLDLLPEDRRSDDEDEDKISKEEYGQLNADLYKLYKRRVYELEPKNYTKLYFIRQHGNWFRAFGHSAIIYHYDICSKIHRRSKLLIDNDYTLRIPGGVVNVSDMDVLETKLNTAGYSLIVGNERCRVFNLGRRYTDAELKAMEEAREREIESINRVVEPKRIYPYLSRQLRQLFRDLYFALAKLDSYARHCVGEEIVHRALDLLTEYSLMASDCGQWRDKEPVDFLEYADGEVHWIQSRVGFLMEIRVLEYRKITTLLETTGKLLREIKACLSKELK